MGFSLVFLEPKEKEKDFQEANPETRKTILPSLSNLIQIIQSCRNIKEEVDDLWEEMKKIAKLPIKEPEVLEFPLSTINPYTIGSKEKYKGWPIKPNYSFILQNIRESKHLVSPLRNSIEPHITIPDENIPPKAVELIQYTAGGDHPLHHPYGTLEIKNIQKDVPIYLNGKKLKLEKEVECKYGDIIKIGKYSFLIESFKGTELDRWVEIEDSIHRMEWPSHGPGGEPIIY